MPSLNRGRKNANKVGTATAFPLRLRVHYKAARASGVKRGPGWQKLSL